MNETSHATSPAILAQRGFSMIEILVVVAIIGMLAGLVATNVIGQGEKAKRKAVFAQIKMFDDALEMYKLDKGKYPTADRGLATLVEGNYVKERKMPKDPWGNDYRYVVPGPSGMPYDIVSLGADGADGGSGDDADISLSKGLDGGEGE